jgi:hypothetical protein
MCFSEHTFHLHVSIDSHLQIQGHACLAGKL